MIKVLYVGMFNNIFEETNALLNKHYSVQICGPDINAMKGIVKMNRPDVIVVSLSGLDPTARLLTGIYNKFGTIPAVCFGTDFEQRGFDVLQLTDFFHILTRPFDEDALVNMVNKAAVNGNPELAKELDRESSDDTISIRKADPEVNVDLGMIPGAVSTSRAKSDSQAEKRIRELEKKLQDQQMEAQRLQQMLNPAGGGVRVGGGGVSVGNNAANMQYSAVNGNTSNMAHSSVNISTANAGNSVNNVSSQAQETSAKHTRKSILVVDDSTDQLMLINKMLSIKYDVRLASDAMRAMKLLGKRKPDAILLDYEMPDINGKRTLEMIRDMHDTQDIPVIFLTGERSEENVRAVMQLHPAGYLLKPASAEAIFAALEKAWNK